MSVKTISKDELRRMEGSEGLIIQGCGGSLDEWVDGINDMLTEDGILLDGTRFHDCSTFEHDGSTCLLFPFKDDVKLDVGRLAMWRLQTHGNFGGTWLSDYVPNRLGGFISKEQTAETAPKPDCPLIGQDGNIFNLMGIASRTLKQNGLADQAKEVCDRIRESGDYYKALGVIGEYLGKIILILNNTPQYIVRETINSDAAASEKVRTLIRAAAGEAAAETEEEPEKL